MSRFAKSAAVAMGVAAAATYLAAHRKATAAQGRRRKLSGQVVLITGGSRGLGLALAQAFGRLHCRIAISARDKDELQRAQETLIGSGLEVFTVPCDVSHEDEVAAMIQAVIHRYGQIDVLVNNAGEIMVSPYENLNASDFERAMAVMFWGMFYTTRAVLPSMKAQGQGRIVNITSIGGKVSVPHLLSYSCAKAAGLAFSNGLRSELPRFGIEVTTVVPGLMRTGSHVNALFKGDHVPEASWFGVAASLPLLTLDAGHAAELVIKAICAGKTEAELGLPAQLLSTARTLLPGLTAHLLQLSNALLPKGTGDHAVKSGRELNAHHGGFYRILTTLGRKAGQRLNQPV